MTLSLGVLFKDRIRGGKEKKKKKKKKKKKALAVLGNVFW